MFRSNKHHLQPALISNVNELPAKRRQHLEASWAGTFRREFFSRLKEEAFAVLYSDLPSRPNVPVNVLVSLDTLKAGYGWSDNVRRIQRYLLKTQPAPPESQENRRKPHLKCALVLAARIAVAHLASVQLPFLPFAGQILGSSC